MRIAILTFHRAYNCGAMLQAWALKTVLERMGHTVEFPCGSYNTVGWVPLHNALYTRRRQGPVYRKIGSYAYRLLLTIIGKGTSGVRVGKYYDAFRQAYLPERNCDIKDFTEYYDAIILGSDQVLNPNLPGWKPYFLCRDIPNGIHKIAYAVSVGEKPLSTDMQADIVAALGSFAAVSVREPFSGYAVMPDPTLLLDAVSYDSVAKPYKARKEYLYMYSCEASEFEVSLARKIATRLRLDLIITPTHGKGNRKDKKFLSNKISPAMLVSYIKGAKYVLAGSFHGAAIALVNGKSFLNVLPDCRPAKRVSTMLQLFDEADRIVGPDVGFDEVIRRLTRPLNQELGSSLAAQRNKGVAWLKTALDGLPK